MQRMVAKRAALTWPPGLAETPRRRTWFERFRTLPPGLTVRQAADRLGTYPEAVRAWGRKLGYAFTADPNFRPPGLAETPVRRTWFERFRTLPPGLTVRQAADRLGTYPAAVRAWGPKLGYAFTADPSRRPPAAWGTVDWTRSNAAIAADLKVSPQAVHAQRVARGKPRRRPGRPHT